MAISVLTAFDFEPDQCLGSDLYGIDYLPYAGDDLHLNEREISRERERTRQQLQERIRQEERSNPDVIGEVLTSAIDDTLFIAYFDADSGRVSFYYADGQKKDWYRYVDGEDGFNELVAINSVVTSELATHRTTVDRVNRNTASIDVEARLLIEYDEHGNRTETYLCEEFADVFPESRVFTDLMGYDISSDSFVLSADGYVGVAPMFVPVNTWMFVPFGDHPVPYQRRQGSAALVGGRYHQTAWNTTRVTLRTFEFPMEHGRWMWFIDVFITNAIGDCARYVLDLRENREFFHNVRFPGEPYGAWVNSYCGSFNNVRLNFFNAQQQAPSQITIHLNANGGSVSPTSIQRTPGTYTMGFLPTPSREAGWRFVGWYDTPAQTGGNRITNNTRVPNSTTTYWARWQPNVSIVGRWENGSTISFISHRDFSTDTRSQFAQRMSHVNGHIGYSMLSNSSQTHIMNTWLTSSHNADGLNRVYRQFLGTNRALGYCAFHWHRPYAQINGYWRIAETDIVINVSHPFANNPVHNADFCVSTVFLHEAVHAVGLYHTNNRSTNGQRNIMYFQIGAREQIHRLGPDDIAGIRYLNYRR